MAHLRAVLASPAARCPSWQSGSVPTPAEPSACCSKTSLCAEASQYPFDCSPPPVSAYQA
eukprot:4026151-Alexandrium_andersonii.AAC.1